MNEPKFPKSRRDCIARELDAEVVIYDPERHKGHCLNSTAAAVWKLCDGRQSSSDIAKLLSDQFSAHIDEQVVQLALQQLGAAHLLEQPGLRVKPPSRRAALRRITVGAAVALPLITSMVAPEPANAQSCLHNLQSCTSNAQCCSGICAGTPPVGKVCVDG
jgi:hypothetical protein